MDTAGEGFIQAPVTERMELWHEVLADEREAVRLAQELSELRAGIREKMARLGELAVDNSV